MEYRQIPAYTMGMSELVDRLMELNGGKDVAQNTETLMDSLYVITPDDVPPVIPHELFYRHQVADFLRYLMDKGEIPYGHWFITA